MSREPTPLFPPRILHLEDNPADAELIHVALGREWPGCHVMRVETQAGFLEGLQQSEYNLILSDFSMPGFDGLSALALARRHRPEWPFIFLSGTIGEDHAVEALKHGATDYVLKDRMGRLVTAIRRALGEMEEHRRRRTAEQRLREQAELLDKARDAICVTDLAGCLTYLNQSAERLLGWTATEAHGQPLAKRLSRLGGTGLTEAQRAVRADGSWAGELHMAAPSGGTLVVDSHWTLVRDADGHPQSILLINTDITEQKKLENQLLRAQRMESIGTLTGGIAHDLNNVLAPILMAVQILQKSVTDAPGKKLLGTMETSAERGAALIRQLLTFARGSEARRTELQIRTVIGDVEKLLRQTLPRSIELQVRYPADPWLISGDASQLGQVLMNLGVNARDAMPQGGRIEIITDNVILDEAHARLLPECRPGPYLHITVADTGTGIPPEIIEKIFDPFFTTKEPGKGTGLGLSTVRGILKGHDGALHVESEVGRGTAFQIYLPALPGLREQPAAAAHRGPEQGHGEGILVIDDDDAVREVMCSALKTFGYKVRSAADGQTGLKEYRGHAGEIDLVLTDMMMPGLAGVEVIKTLRGINPTVRIIAMSGLMEAAALKEEKVGFGRLEVLPKPLSIEQLLATVRRVLTMP
ncbi:MAG: response regulator [Opitutaceae bacterium]